MRLFSSKHVRVKRADRKLLDLAGYDCEFNRGCASSGTNHGQTKRERELNSRRVSLGPQKACLHGILPVLIVPAVEKERCFSGFIVTFFLLIFSLFDYFLFVSVCQSCWKIVLSPSLDRVTPSLPAGNDAEKEFKKILSQWYGKTKSR